MSEETTIKSIIAELVQPQNHDLLIEIIGLGDADKHQSFMWGFSEPHAHKLSSFEDYANFIRTVEMQFKEQGFDVGETVDMSKAYDKYLADVEESIAKSPINKTQAQRFDAIVNKHDDGWSGAYYGFLMRKIQATLRLMFAAEN